jgi:tetratricopeptide (TPR) repeat protein
MLLRLRKMKIINMISTVIVEGIPTQIERIQQRTKGVFGRDEERLFKCLGISEHLPEDHPDLVGIYTSLGDLYRVKGDYAKAEDWYLKCLAIREQHPENQSDLAAIYISLGNLYLAKRDFARAEDWYTKCYAIRKHLPSGHPDLASIYASLGDLNLAKRDFVGAEDWYLKCYDTRADFSSDHPDLAAIYISLGDLYQAKRDFARAEKWYLKCYSPSSQLADDLSDEKVFNLHRPRRKMAKVAWMEFPDRIYSYTIDTGALNWVNIRSKQRDSKTIEHSFRYWCTLTELSDGNLLIAGGSLDAAFTAACTEVKELNTQTFELTVKPSMLYARWAHGSTYFEGEVYMVSGMNGTGNHISQCERYNCTSQTWEALPDIPQKVRCTNPITVEATGCIFVFGGYNDSAYQDCIQKLDLGTLSWRLLDVRLNTKTYLIPCFKLSSEATDVFYVESGSLYKFDTLQYKISLVRAVTIPSKHYQGPSYYFNSMLYMSRNNGQAEIAAIGELS